MVTTSRPAPSVRVRRAPGPATLRLLLVLLFLAGAVVGQSKAAPKPSPSKALASRGPRPPEAGVYRFEDLTALEAARIDRDLAVLLQPIGGIEPFGPHLPVGAAALVAEELALATGRNLRKDRPELSVILLPTLHMATAPAVAYGLTQLHPTALNVSSPTFREILFNSTLRLAEGAWRHYFTISYSFSPEQNRRQEELCAFLGDAYGIKAANLSGLALVDSVGLDRQVALALATFRDTLEVKPRLDIHGGTALTSLLLALRPGSVDPAFKTLPNVALRSIEEFPLVAGRLGWPTYVGAPARAVAVYGQGLLDILSDVSARHALDILAGTGSTLGPTPATWATEEFNWRDPLRNMADWEARKRSLYDAWLKAHEGGALKPDGAPH